MRKLVLAGLLLMAGAVLMTGVASASPTSGVEHFQITTVNDNPGGVLARGVFTASGTDYPKTGHTDLFVFADGAFTVHHPGGSESFSLNPQTCLVKITLSGSYSVKGGVGRYQGITGSGTYTGTVTGVLPRNPNGTCDTKKNAQPFSTVQHISAKGPLSFAG